jgi:hypothetical protein
MTWLIAVALYLALPAVAILITGRQITWQGWIFIVLLWPIAWAFMGPEELP